MGSVTQKFHSWQLGSGIDNIINKIYPINYCYPIILTNYTIKTIRDLGYTSNYSYINAKCTYI